MDTLFIITARGGSRGIPGKNIKMLGEQPLLHYSISFARQFTGDEHICLSTDNEHIIRSAKKIGLKVPFIRPAYLATDHAGSYAVIRHAFRHYQAAGRHYDCVVLLQPTSPFRKKEHLEESYGLFGENTDMVVSVCESEANPYFNLYEENDGGCLKISKGDTSFATRQSAPRVYRYNGSLYLIKPESLVKYENFGEFRTVKKYVMDPKYSVDLDTPDQWEYAEFLWRGNFRSLITLADS
ncbi:MAG TPA: acylneuraminate cytidylyltransferase family protein [Chitinophagaceae bacterium]|nr:acylneuraminate cytidylyltransferase family protein [Chitinophagaceae bacterium]